MDYQPLIARTCTVHRHIAPAAYDCLTILFIRDGSAILLHEAQQKPVKPGDVILLGNDAHFGAELEGLITVTSIQADSDYILDQFFWQHTQLISTRCDAKTLAQSVYTQRVQVLSIGEQRAGILMPWLDEFVRLSTEGGFYKHTLRVQALWFLILDLIAPFIETTSAQTTLTSRAWVRPTHPRHRRFTPLRAEVRQVRDALHDDIAHPWALTHLAGMVHLSTKQLSRLFVRAYGKTPLAFLTMLRIEEMARLLRETDLSVEQAGRQVGWHSRNRASEAFKQAIGMTPSKYRALRESRSGRGPCCRESGL